MKKLTPLTVLAAISTCAVLSSAPAVAATFDLSFDPSSDVGLISVKGIIEPGDGATFYDFAQRVERAVVLLESPGGNVQEGISIAAEIAYRGFNTLVADGDGCHSICAIIWTSGASRYMAREAEISVHAAYRPIQQGTAQPGAAESGLANALIGAYLNEGGLSREAISYFTIARPDEPLLPITPEIAQRLNIDVFVLDGDQLTPPQDRPTPRRIARNTTVLSAMSSRCSDLLGVDSELYLRQADRTLRLGHDLFGGDTFAKLIPEYLTVAQDEIRSRGGIGWCHRSEESLRLDSFDTGISGPSFDCRRATTAAEVSICDSATLWAMDRAVSYLYTFLRSNVPPHIGNEVLAQQRHWLASRDRCGGNHACLIDRYRSRLTDLGL
jgi:hypothetical protein